MNSKASLLVTGAIIGATSILAFTQPRLFTDGAQAASASVYQQLNLFADVFGRVRQDYVEKPDDAAMIQAAINGMVNSLDPHSSYLSPKDFKDMETQMSGQFGGLGLEVTMENGVIKVVSPIDDTPAAKAGILANDFITALDGENVQGMTLSQAVDKMRGAVNTPITLTIFRKGADKPFDVKLLRAEITVQSVRLREDG
jgi:carboxyl-terminal processing protease